MKADIKVTLTKDEIQKALAEYVRRNVDLSNAQVDPSKITFKLGVVYDHDPRMTTTHKVLESATIPLTQGGVRGTATNYLDR